MGRMGACSGKQPRSMMNDHDTPCALHEPKALSTKTMRITPETLSFFHALESGKGWAECAQYCTTTASFTCQATDALPGPPVTACDTVESYAEWMAGVCANMGNQATYKLNAKGFDEESGNALLFATFGGFSHYVYMMHVDVDGKIDSVTKCWNDGYTFAVMSSQQASAAA